MNIATSKLSSLFIDYNEDREVSKNVYNAKHGIIVETIGKGIS